MTSLGETKDYCTSSDSITSYSIVQSTVRDLFDAHHSALQVIRSKAEKQKLQYVPKVKFEEVLNALTQEKLEHEKTKLNLEKEVDKVQFGFEENNILKVQFQKEKEAYEAKIKTLQSKASRETKRSEFLHQKCLEAERRIEQLSDELTLKENEIMSHKKKLKMQADSHKQKLAEIDINKLQQDYMVKTLGNSLKAGKTLGSSLKNISMQ